MMGKISDMIFRMGSNQRDQHSVIIMDDVSSWWMQGAEEVHILMPEAAFIGRTDCFGP